MKRFARQVGVSLLATIVVTGLCAWITDLTLGREQVRAALLGGVASFPAAVAIIAIVCRFGLADAAVFGGMFVRVVLTLGGAAAVSLLFNAGGTPYVATLCAAYFVNLMIETVWVSRMVLNSKAERSTTK